MKEFTIPITRNQAKILLQAHEDLSKKRIESFNDLTLDGLDDIICELTDEKDIEKAIEVLKTFSEFDVEIKPDKLPQATTPDKIQLQKLVEDMEKREAKKKEIYSAFKTQEELRKKLKTQPVSEIKPPIIVSPESTYIPTPARITLSNESMQKIKSFQNESAKGKEDFVKKYQVEYKNLTTQVGGSQLPQIVVKRSLENFWVQLQNTPKYLTQQIAGTPSLGEKMVLEAVAGPEVAQIFTSVPVRTVQMPITNQEIKIEEPIPASIPFASIRLSLAAKEIAKKDQEKAVAAHLASKGFVDPTQMETIRQKAAVLGVVIEQKRLEEIARIVSKHQYEFLFLSNVNKEVKLNIYEFQAIASAEVPTYDQMITPSFRGVPGFFLRVGQQVFGKQSKELIDKAVDKGIEKLGKTALGKAAKELAKKAAGQIIATGGLTAVLTPVLGFLAPFAAKAITWIAEKTIGFAIGLIKRFFKWLKDNPDQAFALGIGLALFSGLFGFIPGIVGGIAFSGLAAMAGGTQIAATAGSGLVLLASGFGRVAATAFSEIAKPLLISMIAFPLMVGFILLVINNSAYIVPTSAPLGGLPGGVLPPDAVGQCPLTGNYYIGTGSYNGSTGHGSEAYWGGIQPKDRYAIPIWAQFPKSPPEFPNGCVDAICPYYGYAIDVHPTSNTSDARVFAPKICDTENNCVEFWTVVQIIPHPYDWGVGVQLAARTSTGTQSYLMYLAHIKLGTLPSATIKPGAEIPVGTVIGPLHALSEPHVHIEINIDGTPVKPEFLCNLSGIVQ